MSKFAAFQLVFVAYRIGFSNIDDLSSRTRAFISKLIIYRATYAQTSLGKPRLAVAFSARKQSMEVDVHADRVRSFAPLDTPE